MIETNNRGQRYLFAAARLHDHIQSRLDSVQGFPDSPTWGYAFCVLLSSALGNGTFTPLGINAISLLSRQDHANANYPWEFVVYAVQKSKRLLPIGSALPCDVHRHKGTRMLNWFLLRQLNRGWFKGHSPRWILLKLLIAKRLYTTPQGQLLDEFRTRSLQYHAFCLFLLCELIEQHPKAAFLQEWLIRGVRFSAAQILTDGTSLWIGRGQEQIFGYGALIYAMEYAHLRFNALSDPSQLDLLQQHVLQFQRPDGSFPLVLRQREPEVENTCFNENPPGWYGYNTLYDYQPFLAYLLWRTSQLEP